MNISIFGLGYVGAVTAGCLAGRGHRIVGVDVSSAKVESLNQGLAPIIEPGLPELLKAAQEEGRLRATTRCDEALRDTEVSIVCVGTPSSISGALDLSFVRGVLQEMGECLRRHQKRHTLVLRSTMLPGSTEVLIGEILGDLEQAGMLIMQPEGRCAPVRLNSGLPGLPTTNGTYYRFKLDRIKAASNVVPLRTVAS